MACCLVVLGAVACEAEEPPTAEETREIGGSEVSDASGDGDPDSTSAQGEPGGTRTLDVIPDELPASVAPDDARDLEGTVARAGDDWSAAVSFLTDRELEPFARELDGMVRSDGYELRQRVLESERIVNTYDGPDGGIMTVTLRPDGDATRATAVIVSN